MKVSETHLPGVLIVEPVVHEDRRGSFLETFHEERYRQALGAGIRFVQDNQSHSVRGVVRGLHCQTRRPQGKLVRCSLGEVFDVAVNIDVRSDAFGQWLGIKLSTENHRQLWIPQGYAHGFQVLSAEADVNYKCTDYYDPGGESGLIWNDPDVGIEWPLAEAIVSDKDRQLPNLAQFERDSA